MADPVCTACGRARPVAPTATGRALCAGCMAELAGAATAMIRGQGPAEAVALAEAGKTSRRPSAADPDRRNGLRAGASGPSAFWRKLKAWVVG